MHNKELLIKILDSIRNVNNDSVISKIKLMLMEKNEEVIDKLFKELGNDENLIRKYIEDYVQAKLLENLKASPNYYQNKDKDKRESRTFQQISKAYEKVWKILEEHGITVFVAGGTVPYFLLEEDSGRMHDDIDSVCSIKDIDDIRKAMKRAKLYNPEWDSMTYTNNKKDYGFEIMVDGVPIGFYPFDYRNGQIYQYTFDPYMCVGKTQTMKVANLSDYVTTYISKKGRVFHTMSLEYIKKSKDHTLGRDKDKIDSKKIIEYGFNPEVYDRIVLPKLLKTHDLKSDIKR